MPGRSGFIYFKGNADLNAAHIISVVGTRRASAYGQEVTERLLRDLSVNFSRIYWSLADSHMASIFALIGMR